MRYPKNMLQKLAVAVAMLFLYSAQPFCGEEAAKDEKDASLLPGDMIVHIRTNEIEGTIKSFEDYVFKCFEGTPAMLPFQPGMAVMMLPTVTKLPAGAVDMKGSFEFAVCDGGKTALIIPVVNYATQIETMKTAGMVEEQENGVVKINNPMGGQGFLAEIKNGVVASSDQMENAAHVATVMKGWNQEPFTGKASAVITVDLDKIMTLNKGDIDEGLEEMENELAREFNGDDAPAVLKPLAKLLPELVKSLKGVAEQAASARVYLYPETDIIRVSIYLSPKPGTDMQTYFAAYEASQPKYELVKYLPKNSMMVEGMNCPKDAMAVINPFITKTAKDFGGILGEDLGTKLSEVFKGMLDNCNGEGVLCLIPSEAGDSFTSVMYYQAENPQKYLDSLKGFYANVQPTVDSIFKIAADAGGEEIPFKIKVDVAEKVGNVEGVDYSSVKIKLEGLPEGDDMGFGNPMKEIQKIIESLNSVQALVGDTVVIVSGKDAEKALGAAIANLKNKAVGVGNREGVTDSINAIKNKQMAVGMFYYLDFMKITMSSQGKQMPTLAKAVKAIPDSKYPIVFSGGVRKTPAKDATPENHSMKFQLHVPAVAVAEIITAMQNVQKAMMTDMMQNMNNGQGFDMDEAEQGDGDEDDDDDDADQGAF